MSIISFNGIDYGCSGSPKIEQITEANYQALVQAGEVDPSIAYFRMDAPSLYPLIQDDASATDLENGKLATGQTIESYINSRIQDNASAADLENGKLATGQTIKNWAKTPTRVSYTDVTIASGVTMRFELYSNGMKEVICANNTLSNALIQIAAGTIPAAYRRIDTTTVYFTACTSAYETNGTRLVAIRGDGGINIYKSASAGIYLCVTYM